MKRIAGGVVVLALLLAACGSKAVPAAQTVTKTATKTAVVSMTATTVAATETETTVQMATVAVAATTFSQMEIKILTVTQKTTETATPDVKTVAVTKAVTVTETQPAVTVTVEAPAGGPASGGSSLGNGEFLVGTEIQPGTYKCAGGTNLYWKSLTKAGDIIDNALDSGIARVPAEAYSMVLDGCDAEWFKIG